MLSLIKMLLEYTGQVLLGLGSCLLILTIFVVPSYALSLMGNTELTTTVITLKALSTGVLMLATTTLLCKSGSWLVRFSD